MKKKNENFLKTLKMRDMICEKLSKNYFFPLPDEILVIPNFLKNFNNRFVP